MDRITYDRDEGYVVETYHVERRQDAEELVEAVKELEHGTQVMVPLDGVWISREEALDYLQGRAFALEIETFLEEGQRVTYQLAYKG